MTIRLLVIEDDEEIADFICRGLREEGFLVEVAVEGLSGWHALQTAAWDAAVLDWWLPGLDGLTLLQRFRQVNQTTPVLFLTARDAVEQRVQGLNAGADDYLCKPFAFTELVARVHALLRRRPGSVGTQLKYQDVAMDLTTQRVERAGRPLDLTAKEHALLLFFCAIRATCCRAAAFMSTSGRRRSTVCPTPWKSTSWSCAASSKHMAPD